MTEEEKEHFNTGNQKRKKRESENGNDLDSRNAGPKKRIREAGAERRKEAVGMGD